MSTDEQLIHNVAAQDEQALLALYQRYGARVKGMAFQVLHDDALAEEVTQDVFLKLWRQPDRWNASLGALSTWLMAITRNAAIDRLRAEQRRPIHGSVTAEHAADQLSQESMTDDPAWSRGHLLRELLGELPPEQAQLIELAFYQGMTHSELANALDLPLGTVKTRLRRGLQRLRALWHDATGATPS